MAGYQKSGASEGDYRRLVEAFSDKPSLHDLAAAASSGPGLLLPTENTTTANQPSSYRDALPASNTSLFWINLRRSWIQQMR